MATEIRALSGGAAPADPTIADLGAVLDAQLRIPDSRDAAIKRYRSDLLAVIRELANATAKGATADVAAKRLTDLNTAHEAQLEAIDRLDKEIPKLARALILGSPEQAERMLHERLDLLQKNLDTQDEAVEATRRQMTFVEECLALAQGKDPKSVARKKTAKRTKQHEEQDDDSTPFDKE